MGPDVGGSGVERSVEPRIVVVGSINVDLVVSTPRFPGAGETIIGGDLRIVSGGKGANQAAAAAKLGASVTMVGCIGDDVFGPQQLANLVALGVDVTRVSVRRDAPTGTALIAVDDKGANTIIVAPGANGKLTVGDIRHAEHSIASANAVLLQLEVPVDAVLQAIQLAKAQGVMVILNAAPAQQLARALLGQVDVLVANETEAAILTGIQVDSLESFRPAACRLKSWGVGTVILTLGERGALAVDAQRCVHVPGFSVHVVDTTAAGDAFVAALAVALAERLDLPGAVRFANAAGALAATRPGAQPSLPTRSEVDGLFLSYPA